MVETSHPLQTFMAAKGHELLVDEQCEAEFQIYRYKDKIICDIMPMDVCRILLGRPWQYDGKVVHDGQTNCCKFFKDGIKHMLVLIKGEGTIGTSETRALLVSRKEFLKQVEDSEVSYAIVWRERTILLHIKVLYLTLEIQQMLHEFTDIVVDDLSDKLPLERSISHHIDFIPGVRLPNKVAYQMSTKDNEGIRK